MQCMLKVEHQNRARTVNNFNITPHESNQEEEQKAKNCQAENKQMRNKIHANHTILRSYQNNRCFG